MKMIGKLFLISNITKNVILCFMNAMECVVEYNDISIKSFLDNFENILIWMKGILILYSIYQASQMTNGFRK